MEFKALSQLRILQLHYLIIFFSKLSLKQGGLEIEAVITVLKSNFSKLC